MSDRRYHIVLNARAGTALGEAITPEDLKARFEGLGLDTVVDADLDRDLADRIEAAIAGPADTIVAAGGDGTVTALASALIGTGKTLALLPLGTANLLARDLGIPLDLNAAILALAAMEPQQIDVGEMNGRVFLHKAVIGFAPEVAAGREKIRERTGLAAKLGFLKYFLKRVMRPQKLTIDIAVGDGVRRRERVRSIAVANNSYDEGVGRIFARKRLDRGSLSVYILRRFHLLDLVRLSAGMLVGRWRTHDALTIEAAEKVELYSDHAVLQVMVDGEVERVETPLRFRIRPLALSVLAPVVEEPAA